MKIQLQSLADTEKLGTYLGQQVEAGDIITLSGDLGAGKTTLTQFIGRGLGVPSHCYITSPTFSLLHKYKARIPLYHMDLYRISGDEVYDLGLEEYIYGDGVSIVEWPERFDEMPENRLEIILTFDSDTSRKVEMIGYGTFTERIFDFHDLVIS